jgi:hypothetical protein
MTEQEIAQALENMIQEDAERPSQEQIRELIDAGVIDEHGRILIGNGKKMEQGQTSAAPTLPKKKPPKQRAG